MFLVIMGVGISLYIFYEFLRVKEEKQDERRDSLNERRQQYLDRLLQAKKKEQGAAEDVVTNGSNSGASDSGDMGDGRS